MTARMDIEVPRNGDYFMGWQLRDSAGDPLDLTGVALALHVRAVAGQGIVIADATISDRVDNQGSFNVRIAGSDFRFIPGDSEIVRLAYDFLATASDDIKIVEVRGQIILMPGVTT
ncbi:hypothetical protein [Sphingobium sp. ZW T5_29]|uniref:hypothetical protein n=1 Tax=Sphingobium sp. ZW T5_29 TaxID=3378077 RepID=UPI0038527D26